MNENVLCLVIIDKENSTVLQTQLTLLRLVSKLTFKKLNIFLYKKFLETNGFGLTCKTHD